jgi:formate hydrogenlyase subunit 4
MGVSGVLVQIVQGVLVVLLAPLLTGIARKTKARLLMRRGASVLQPYRDLLRLFRKESVVAENASWLFLAAPTLIFSFTWVAASIIPTFSRAMVLAPAADLVAIVGLLGSARFLLALSGLDVGTSFGGIGASREVMFASIAEPALLMLIFSLALVARSTRLDNIAAFVLSPAVGLRISLALALIGLIMIAIVENGRIPIDNPATHLELTMVHEAMVLEYSGRHLALIDAASSLKLLAYVSFIGAVFVPWGLAAEGASLTQLGAGLLTWIAKVAASGVLLGVFEVSVAKMRVFRVPQFAGAAMMLALLAVLLRLVSRSF